MSIVPMADELLTNLFSSMPATTIKRTGEEIHGNQAFTQTVDIPLSKLTDLGPAMKLFISNKLVHHILLQFSTSSFKNSQSAPHGVTEYNPTKRHTEYIWSG